MSTWTWTLCGDALPPKDLMVEICNLGWTDHLSWLGWHDGKEWHLENGMVLDAFCDSGEADAEPTHWKLRTPLPMTEGARIVTVLSDTPGGDSFTFLTEFDPDLGAVEDTHSGQVYARILTLVAEICKGEKPKEGN